MAAALDRFSERMCSDCGIRSHCSFFGDSGLSQELILWRVGIIASLFFGFIFGMSGITAAVLGYVADKTSLQFIFKFCFFLPLFGILTILLPDVEWYKN
jgi:hypothetical protein